MNRIAGPRPSRRTKSQSFGRILLTIVALVMSGCTNQGVEDLTRSLADRPLGFDAEAEATETGPVIEPEFIFKGEVSLPVKRTVKLYTRKAFELFSLPLQGEAPFERYVEVFGRGSPYDPGTHLCGELTSAGGIRLYVDACAGFGWEALSDTIAHEAFHAVQAYVFETYDEGLPYVVDGAVPHWFIEGSASWAAAMALDEWDLVAYDDSLWAYAVSAQALEGDLDDFETGERWLESEDQNQLASQYAISFLAVDQVAGRNWELALEFYRRAVVQPDQGWESAFSETFGTSPSAFYEDFAAELEW